MDLFKIALDYCSENSLSHDGHVVLYREPGSAGWIGTGWTLFLDNPAAYVPGCLALSLSTRHAYVAAGGDDYNGALDWVFVPDLSLYLDKRSLSSFSEKVGLNVCG